MNHNAMRAFVYVFQLLSSIVAAIFEATKMVASDPQRNRFLSCIYRIQSYLVGGVLVEPWSWFAVQPSA
jgi:hypothetical protein